MTGGSDGGGGPATWVPSGIASTLRRIVRAVVRWFEEADPPW